MLRRCIRLAVAVGLVAWLAGSPAAWGTATVTVTFSGTGTSSFPNTTFSGSFNYTTALTSANGTFTFTPYSEVQYSHLGNYTVSSTVNPPSDSYVPMNTYKITAVGASFVLDTMLTQTTPATEMQVQFALMTACDGHHLPPCSYFPASGGSFTLLQSGTIKYQGNIQTVSCSQVGLSAPAYYGVPCVAVSCQPAWPMAACPPRPGCFARLFARSGRRVRCW